MTEFLAALRHEIRRARRDRAMPWLILAFVALSAYAAYSGRSWADERRSAESHIASELRKSRAEYIQRVSRVPADSAALVAKTLAAGLEYRPTLPTPALAALSSGQADGYSQSAKFFALSRDADIFDAPTASLDSMPAAGRFDLAFVIVVLLPLFLFAATYDLWTEEREIGTSAMVLSQPVNTSGVLAAKALARGASLLLVATVVVVLLIAASAYDQKFTIAALAAATMSMVSYGSVWIAVAICINVFVRRSTTAALAGLGAWLCAVVLLPALMSASLDLIAPALSRAVHAETLRLASLEPVERTSSARAAPEAKNASLPPRVRALQMSLDKAQVEERRYADLARTFEARSAERLAREHRMRFMSPAVIMQDTLDRIAGTDADRSLLFQQQVRQFLGGLRRYASNLRGDEAGARVDDTVRELPQFRFREPARPIALSWLGMDWAALGAYALAILVVAGLGLRRRLLYTREFGVPR